VVQGTRVVKQLIDLEIRLRPRGLNTRHRKSRRSNEPSNAQAAEVDIEMRTWSMRRLSLLSTNRGSDPDNASSVMYLDAEWTERDDLHEARVSSHVILLPCEGLARRHFNETALVDQLDAVHSEGANGGEAIHRRKERGRATLPPRAWLNFRLGCSPEAADLLQRT
jgi:hypothetical protein